MNPIPVLKIQFQQEISSREIPLFRGAVIASMENANILFHNHDNESLRYSYPLIQYKRIGGKAAIVFIGEGVEKVGVFFGSGEFHFRIGDRDEDFTVADVAVENHHIDLADGWKTYRLNHWLPLNQENHEQYLKLDGLAERYAMLERMLVGNILSFAKSMNVFFEDEIVCKIVSVEKSSFVQFKGMKMMALNCVIKTNIALPYYIGLGKGVSIGHGVISKYVQEPKQDRK